MRAPRRLVAWVVAVAAAALAPPVARSQAPGDPDAEGGAAAPAAAADPGPPRGAGAGARDRWLAGRIDAALAARPELRAARVGIAVIDVSSGVTRYARGADDGFAVASVAKLVTAAAALAILGPEFRFRTILYAEGTDGHDTIKGDLFLRGAGDPALSTQTLWALVADLRLAGVRRISGGVVIDDSYFDAKGLPPAWEQKDEDAAYRAPVGAASLNYSSVAVRVQPGARAGEPARVTLDPTSDYFVVTNRAVTVAGGRTRLSIASSARGDRTVIDVSGTIRAGAGVERARKRVHHPERYLGETLRAFLVAQGIRVERRGVRAGAVPTTARAVAAHASEPLAVLVRDMIKHSNNVMAEDLLKVIGAEAAGAPGTWAKGLAAVHGWLADAGIAAGSYRLDNGSGLYDSNRLSPRHVTTVLRHAYRDFRYSADFVAALALAGADGTIGHRMAGGAAERYVRAKTGTLDGVSCLAGYAGAVGRPPLAFAVLVNDIPKEGGGSRAARGLQDEIAAALVLYLEAE